MVIKRTRALRWAEVSGNWCILCGGFPTSAWHWALPCRPPQVRSPTSPASRDFHPSPPWWDHPTQSHGEVKAATEHAGF